MDEGSIRDEFCYYNAADRRIVGGSISNAGCLMVGNSADGTIGMIFFIAMVMETAKQHGS